MKGGALLKEHKLLVQGITGRQGGHHTAQMLEYGTKVVGGVTPGKGGALVHGVPVFNDVQRAMERTGATASVLFVPALNLKQAVVEGIEAGLEAMVIITERTPIHDAMQMLSLARKKGVDILGPNCPGLCLVGESKVGIMPNRIFRKGDLAVISRSGTLTYEVVQALSSAGLGQSMVLGLGGDRLLGTDMREAVEMVLEKGPAGVVMIGEIGGQMEEEASMLIKELGAENIFAYVAGVSAPPAKRMGHAGAIVSRGSGGAYEKIKALEGSGVAVGRSLGDLTTLISKRFGE
ncbi:MAG: Succinyl-CoA ligase (ADP-forming) subunit alpha [Methanomassiliicoccales archaeon PtaB.Bin215]|nr:MAG: Succinyl-CoA ligase (ADP-forming) subunit alpha [Methanomassiliicoccales archaeon PtaB.Bin215]